MTASQKKPTKKPASRWHLIGDYVIRRRQALIQRLGGKCVDCGSIIDLEFDHLKTRTWCTRKLSQIQRMVKYEEEATAKLIELRCGPCNKAKGRPVPDDYEPF